MDLLWWTRVCGSIYCSLTFPSSPINFHVLGGLFVIGLALFHLRQSPSNKDIAVGYEQGPSGKRGLMQFHAMILFIVISMIGKTTGYTHTHINLRHLFSL